MVCVMLTCFCNGIFACLQYIEAVERTRESERDKEREKGGRPRVSELPNKQIELLGFVHCNNVGRQWSQNILNTEFSLGEFYSLM